MSMEAVKEMLDYEVCNDLKNSGAPWIGAVPSHWRVLALKHLCIRSSLYGMNEPSSSYSDYGVRFLRTTDILDSGALKLEGAVYLPLATVKDYILSDGDVLLSRSGTLGRSFVYQSALHEASAYAGYLVRFVPGPELVPQFLFYYTKSQPFNDWMALTVASVTIGNISGARYANMQVPTPTLREQTRIAAFLDRKCGQIDQAIAQKERLIALLKERRQVLVQQAVTKGLNPKAKMKDSGVGWLGEVPAHWELVPNRHIFQLQKRLVGKAHGDYTLLSLTLNGVIKRDMENPEGKFPAEFDTYQEVKPGEFVFCLFDVEETPRTIGLAKDHGMITGAYTVMANRSSALSEYLYYYYLSLDSQKALRSVYRGLRNTIPKDVFASIKTPLPPPKEQRAIVDKIEANEAKTMKGLRELEASISKLKEYRSILINAAVTGKIKVPEE